ncbi:tRNA (Guanine-N2-)-methyltransferase [Operophtera brumata]|uniref:tRNA (guanine(26)-N(2))-dimethyltransferase n=1 Tax=Operophtera brumata TaxID=104452 RepID=A0A0L7LGT5_OPEBR|nr:tRNA (Guanine-N2-)-methyltransferase [Operophtera brumata]
MNQERERERGRCIEELIRKMNVSVDNETSKTIIKEGKAEISLSTDKVFYNPVQEFNRDLSIAVLSVFTSEYTQEKIAKAQLKAEKRQKEGKEPVDELNREDVSKIIANDISRTAVEVIKENILSNGLEEQVDANHDDACMVMYKHKDKKKRFTAIDLDPYGCPSIFLDAAVQAVQDGGLLLVTATDMAVLAGNSPETCYAKYGAVSLKTKACHEMALRILLQCIESNANRYGRYIEPVLSISADFYIRVFVKVKLSMVYQCTGCGTMTLQQLGGFKPNPTEKRPNQMKSFLPTAPIHDNAFVSRVLSHVSTNAACFGTVKRMEGVLSMVTEELDVPLYYTVEQLVGTVHVESMKMNLLSFGTVKRMEGVLSMVTEELDVPLYYTVEQLVGTVHVESMKMNLLRFVISILHKKPLSKASAP